MQRILPPPRSLGLFGIERTRAIEQRACAALPPHALMRRAGAAVARLALAVAPHASTIWIVCGPGNNGGDGLDAAIRLHELGKQVHVTLLGDPGHLPADARDAWERARAAGIAVDGSLAATPAAELAIDALLGIGATRPPRDALAEAIAHLNALACPVLAIDVPSGLNVDTGQPLGEHAVRARHTLSLLSLKPGLFTAAGRDHAGEVWFDDLGVDTGAEIPDAWLGGSPSDTPPPRRHAQHKGSFGDVAVVAGAPGMSGAALLAGRAALAAGAGRVYVDPLDDRAAGLDSQRPELMFRHGWWKSPEATLLAGTVVCGCGGGEAVREPLPRLLSAAGRLVLDADALNAIAADTSLQALLTARASRARPTVITPHPLEAARLLACTASQVQSDRLASAQALAERFGCVVLLKGSGSVIAAPGEVPCINPTGTAALATPGTGDVLAGWIGGLWSQLGASDAESALRAARAAAWQHGAAADADTARVLRASDLIEAMVRGR
ncbi:MAG TPA: NAD(P)H-hydrate dehydratase [Albitalea sp.]|nr:NAD(P)H-hydrate dehydratase [Albitalea sp.]